MPPRKRTRQSLSPSPSLSSQDIFFHSPEKKVTDLHYNHDLAAKQEGELNNHDHDHDEDEEEEEEDDDDLEENSCLTILFATDNHLGYLEKDPIRGEDSFNTFEEILQLAQTHNVDMLLLGGDLFHENHPSRKTIYKTMELFRAYCFGDRPCPIEILSDQSVNFPNRFATVNYQDPNLNISLPVFAVHGNHDDPTGDGHFSALDLLSVSGLINYFGHHSDLNYITVSPILCRKGVTYLALYGLGYIRDERLYRLFLNHQIEFLQPLSSPMVSSWMETESHSLNHNKEEHKKKKEYGFNSNATNISESNLSWFRLGVVHQNRVPRSTTNYLPESFLPSMLNLVLWGHEHDCQKSPLLNVQQGFHVIQPGSSVATSIIDGEAIRKHVILLKIQGNTFTSTALPLTTVRPMLIDELFLASKFQGPISHVHVQQAQQWIIDKLESMISLAASSSSSHSNTNTNTNSTSMLPLIRLKVDTTGFPSPLCPISFFSHRFQTKVANPKDLVVFYQRKSKQKSMNGGGGGFWNSFHSNSSFTNVHGQGGLSIQEKEKIDIEDEEESPSISMESLVYQLLQQQTLNILPETEFNEAVRLFVDKYDSDAVKKFLSTTLKKTCSYLASTELLSEDQFFKAIAHQKSILNQSTISSFSTSSSTTTTSFSSSSSFDSSSIPKLSLTQMKMNNDNDDEFSTLHNDHGEDFSDDLFNDTEKNNHLTKTTTPTTTPSLTSFTTRMNVSSSSMDSSPFDFEFESKMNLKSTPQTKTRTKKSTLTSSRRKL